MKEQSKWNCRRTFAKLKQFAIDRYFHISAMFFIQRVNWASKNYDFAFLRAKFPISPLLLRVNWDWTKYVFALFRATFLWLSRHYWRHHRHFRKLLYSQWSWARNYFLSDAVEYMFLSYSVLSQSGAPLWSGLFYRKTPIFVTLLCPKF